MKLKSVKIENYKSFGEENNVLMVEDLNTVIGKNESGKSNLIECLSKINLSGITDVDYFKKFNKNTGKSPRLGIVLEPYLDERKKYNITSETLLIFNSQYDIDMSGGLTEMIKSNKLFQQNREKLNELNKNVVNNVFSEQGQRENFRNIISMINNAENKVFINYNYVKVLVERIYNNSIYDEFSEYLKQCISYLGSIQSLLPIFIEINDISLKSKYTRKYLEDSKESKVMLNHLLNCMKVSFDDLMGYWRLSSQDDKTNFEEEFNSKLRDIIGRFNDFYSQEHVEVKAVFEYDSLNFVVRTTKKYMNFDERSNGLKWYLNMYIQILSKTNSGNIENYIILIDEPGVYLHVNAQKELLNLFEDFSKNNNQVIYTTHSPFMIYENKLYRTRLIIKDETGNSNIGNKYYSLPHKMGSKTETITPLLTAIGMNMNYSILNFDSEKINIVTEGISDFNYIKSYYCQKGDKEIFNIIPSTSVDNIHNIVSILIGWGCRFKIILDQDNAGRGQYKVLTNRLVVDGSDIAFVDGTNVPNTKVNVTIEDVFSNAIKSEIGIMNDDYNKEKAYYSLEALKKIENKELEYDAETMNNFDRLINQLFD